jgi:hypothetical protein
MMIYGLGAMWDKELNEYDTYDEVELVIVQPNSNDPEPVKRWLIDADELEEWGDTVLKAAAKAASSKRAKPSAGDWCKWCKHQGACVALRGKVVETAQTVFDPCDETKTPAATPPDPANLTPEQLGQVLHFADMIGDWVDAVKNRAERGLETGEISSEALGWKRVHGRATTRWAADEDAIADKAYELGIEAYEEKLRTYASMRDSVAEKLHERGDYRTKKAAKERAADMLSKLTKTTRGTSLVPNSDKRDALLPAADAFTEAAE